MTDVSTEKTWRTGEFIHHTMCMLSADSIQRIDPNTGDIHAELDRVLGESMDAEVTVTEFVAAAAAAARHLSERNGE